MPIKKIGNVSVSVVSLIIIIVVVSSVIFNFTNDATTDVVAAGVVTLLLIATAWKVLGGRPLRRFYIVILVAAAVIAILMYGASGAKAASTKLTLKEQTSSHFHFPDLFFFAHVKFGGYDWSYTVQRNIGYAAIPGCFWARVWDNGFAPLGGYVDDTVGMTVHWCGIQTLVHGRFGPTPYWKFTARPTFRVWFKAKATAHYDGLVEKPIVRYESCVIGTIREKDGCYHIRITAMVTHAVPPAFISVITGYPAVSMTVNARGHITWVWYSKKLLPF